MANRDLSSPFVDPTSVLHGYSNWKNALSKNKGFYKHEPSDAYSEASSRIAAQSQHADVGSLILSSYATKSSENRNILKKIFASVIFLARQSLPMRSTWSKLAEEEINSNFH